jgi:hypothetical protein
MSMNYFSNFDDSSFEKNKLREFNKTIDDPCALQQRNNDNSKKLKFITTNHIDLLEAKDKLNFFGMTIKDKLFVPAEHMDEDSQLRYGETGGIMTNCNVKNVFGQLPFPTMPSRYQLAHGDVEIEDNMRNLLEINKNSCNPHDIQYHNRSFYIFNKNDEPNPIKSVEDYTRGGVPSRFMKKHKK